MQVRLNARMARIRVGGIHNTLRTDVAPWCYTRDGMDGMVIGGSVVYRALCSDNKVVFSIKSVSLHRFTSLTRKSCDRLS